MDEKVYKFVEDKNNRMSSHESELIEQDIQMALINLLHKQGVLSDSVHTVALKKVQKGVR